jgi:hypothetical protein
MPYFNFERLINKYLCDFTAIVTTNGHYDDCGEWVEDKKTEKALQGAIISFKESKVYRSEGTITANDKRLFTLEPLDNELMGSQIIYNDKLYNIGDCSTENAKFTGFYAYTLKYVSAFKERGLTYEQLKENNYEELSNKTYVRLNRGTK